MPTVRKIGASLNKAVACPCLRENRLPCEVVRGETITRCPDCDTTFDGCYGCNNCDPDGDRFAKWDSLQR